MRKKLHALCFLEGRESKLLLKMRLLAFLLLVSVSSMADTEYSPKESFDQLQKRSIKGKIIDKLGDPLPGANIVVKQSPERGTVSDVNGEFSLQLEEGDKFLIISLSLTGLKKEKV